jgi:histidinol-phosphate aminotransferase
VGTDSKTNFLFIKYPNISGKYIFEELRKKGILVRYFGKAKIEDYMRVTIGTDEEMKIVVEAMKETVKEY